MSIITIKDEYTTPCSADFYQELRREKLGGNSHTRTIRLFGLPIVKTTKTCRLIPHVVQKDSPSRQNP